MLRFTKTELFFLLSPIASIPLVLKDVYRNKRNGYIFVVLLFSIASYLYLPGLTSDKAYYFELHDSFKYMDFNQTLLYITSHSADFLFYMIIFLFAKLGLSFSFTSAVITGITIYLYLLVFSKTVKRFRLNNSIAFFFFIMLIGTLSLPNIFSGLRFYLASAFVLMGLYESIIEGKTLKGVLYLLLATATHFSAIIYLVSVILYIASRRNTILLKIAFLLSFFFLLLPEDLLVTYVGFLDDLNEIYMHKVDSYILGDTNIKITNTGHYIFLFVNHLWYYLVGLYLIYNIRKKNNEYFNLMLIIFIITNVTFSFPSIFYRYSHIAVSVFVLLLMHDFAIYKNKLGRIVRISFFALMIATTFLDIIIQRDRFHESFFKMTALTLPTIIMTDPTDGKHFYKH